MTIPYFPLQIIDWSTVPVERYDGETAPANWQVLKVGDIRVRRMEYAPGYKADHWCKKKGISYIA